MRYLYNLMGFAMLITTDMDKNILTIRQAAEMLGVSMQTLRRWDESGKLRALKTEGGHRYYRQKELEIFSSDIVKLAYEWAVSSDDIPGEFYCSDSATFQSRLGKMQDLMIKNSKTHENFSLIVAMTGEMGNNSYDHNLGNWPDVPGIFFGYDVGRGLVVLADRGIGILATLGRVRTELKGHQEALKVAFTEIVSGRAPEQRGNGLKFVQEVISENDFRLTFQTGDAELELKPHDGKLYLHHANELVRGCIAIVRF